jgi:hypothetical protein
MASYLGNTEALTFGNVVKFTTETFSSVMTGTGSFLGKGISFIPSTDSALNAIFDTSVSVIGKNNTENALGFISDRRVVFATGVIAGALLILKAKDPIMEKGSEMYKYAEETVTPYYEQAKTAFKTTFNPASKDPTTPVDSKSKDKVDVT